MIEILSPGLLTTVQDAGRYGWQKYGVPVSGAMDGWSLAVANLLAGNAPAEGALEITALGPTLRFFQPVAFALAGGDFPAQLDGCPLEMGRAYSARARSTSSRPRPSIRPSRKSRSARARFLADQLLPGRRGAKYLR